MSLASEPKDINTKPQTKVKKCCQKIQDKESCISSAKPAMKRVHLNATRTKMQHMLSTCGIWRDLMPNSTGPATRNTHAQVTQCEIPLQRMDK